MKFKVGDKVVFRSNNGHETIIETRNGLPAIIIKVHDGDRIPYRIQFDDGYKLWIYEDHLESICSEVKAEPSPESETKVLTDKIAQSADCKAY